MTPVDGGQLDCRVQLQRAASAQDATGFNAGAWATYAWASAKIEPAAGKRYVLSQADVTAATATHAITVRYRAGVKATDRVLYRGAAFNLTSVVDVDMAHREIVLLAVVDAGTVVT